LGLFFGAEQMQKVVSFSGGRTSAYLCYLLKTLHPNERIDFVFMDTGAEHPKTYEFIKNVNREFDLNLTCLRSRFDTPLGKANNYDVISIEAIGYDLSIWQAMCEKYSTPYSPSGGFCTNMLKNNAYYQYCNDKYGKDNYETWLGIRIDENRRAKERQNVRYLLEISDYEKQDIIEWWRGKEFNLQLESDILGNCVFCIKRGVNKLALAIKKEPELANDFINMIEAESIRRIDDRKATYDSMYRGQLSLKQIREMYENHDESEIRMTIKGSKSDGSVCSESCELIEMENAEYQYRLEF
jgi:hypothetical protein